MRTRVSCVRRGLGVVAAACQQGSVLATGNMDECDVWERFGATSREKEIHVCALRRCVRTAQRHRGVVKRSRVRTRVLGETSTRELGRVVAARRGGWLSTAATAPHGGSRARHYGGTRVQRSTGAPAAERWSTRSLSRNHTSTWMVGRWQLAQEMSQQPAARSRRRRRKPRASTAARATQHGAARKTAREEGSICRTRASVGYGT